MDVYLEVCQRCGVRGRGGVVARLRDEVVDIVVFGGCALRLIDKGG